MGWRLNVAGANAVLSNVQTHSDAMLQALGSIDGTASGIVSATPGDLVISALNELFSDLAPHAAVLESRPAAAVQGVVTAATVLNGAQSDMAEETRAAQAVVALDAITAPPAPASGGRKAVAW
jgi:hypothetical protein